LILVTKEVHLIGIRKIALKNQTEQIEDYQILLEKWDQETKKLKMVCDELLKKYPSNEISTHPKLDEQYRNCNFAAQKFLKLYVYH